MFLDELAQHHSLFHSSFLRWICKSGTRVIFVKEDNITSKKLVLALVEQWCLFEILWQQQPAHQARHDI